jgi:hypothetical protein
MVLKKEKEKSKNHQLFKVFEIARVIGSWILDFFKEPVL